MVHAPVLTKEVLQHLDPKPDENFIDCTVGEGGHAKLILEKSGPGGKLLGIDWDRQQIENSRKNLASFGSRVMLVHDSYANLEKIVAAKAFGPVNGILIDLGMSSWQLETSQKGFSFLKDEPLDMRYGDGDGGLSAHYIVNEYPLLKLEKIISEYGEEKFAGRIAKSIVDVRGKKTIASTFDLVKIIEEAVPAAYRRERLHYATRTFQALRIAANGELDNLAKFLPQALSVLSSEGRLEAISFHSLEDRIIKNFFKEQIQLGTLASVAKKPMVADEAEIRKNPRSRSAKLRFAIKA